VSGRLVTERLLLRRLGVHDAAALVALDADPEVVRYAEPDLMHAPRTLADVQRHVLPRILAGYDAEPVREYWAVVERAGGAFLGWTFLRPHEGDAWELGYRFRRAAWGRGFATEATRAAVMHGFFRLGIARVVAFVHPDNAASRNVARKLGMTETGTDVGGDLVYELCA
jgi:RimJ/RimL family protein N-acetyltransferase